MLTAVLVLILLIILNAFFAASEMALVSLNDNKIKAMAEDGHKKAKLLHNLLREPSRFLATIQIGITLAGFLASAFAADSFAGVLANALHQAGVPVPLEILGSISVILITLLLSYFTLVLGELVPKRIAMVKSESLAMLAATPLTILSKIVSPFVKLLTLSTNVIVRMFGIDPNANREQVTEEEIRMMVDIGQENGAIQEAEKMMINNIFEFDNKSVSEIMTHRINVDALPVELNLKEAISRTNKTGWTRFPVYEDSIDNVIGIFHVKELLQFIERDSGEAFNLRKLIRKPYFVPEAKKTDELFYEMQLNKIHMAIVIDEYGGAAGVVTFEDLIEEIVGNIYDEYDVEEKEFEKLDENTYRLSGVISLRTLKDQLDVDVPHGEYDTLGGYIISALGRIPDDGEQPVVEFENYVFKVEEVDDMRIGKIKMCKTLVVDPAEQ